VITHTQIDHLNRRLRQVYAADTAQPFDGKWSKGNPTKGHCAVVSMILTDLLPDSMIMTCRVKDGDQSIKHYYVDWAGFNIDLTFDQFSPGSVVYSRRQADLGEYYFTDTFEKYLLLSERVDEVK